MTEGSTHQKTVEAPRLIDFKGDVLTVSAAAPLPPGSRVHVSVPLDTTEAAALPVTGKIVTGAPLSEGRFKLVIRVHSLPREHRAALLDAVATASRNT